MDQALHVWDKGLLGKQASLEELEVSLAALVLVQCKLPFSGGSVQAR